MKKQVKKLQIHRETLRVLSKPVLEKALGGTHDGDDSEGGSFIICPSDCLLSCTCSEGD